MGRKRSVRCLALVFFAQSPWVQALGVLGRLQHHRGQTLSQAMKLGHVAETLLRYSPPKYIEYGVYGVLIIVYPQPHSFY